MKQKIKDVNFLLLFARSKQPSNDPTIKRFVRHVLFDVHLISMMYDYLRFPLVAPFHFGSFGRGDMQFRYPGGLCIHPITGHLWVADTHNRRLCIYQMNILTKNIFPIRTVQCDGAPLCIRISKTGCIVSVVHRPTGDELVIFDENNLRICCKLQLSKQPECLAINDTLQQIAISDFDQGCISIYSMNGIFLRTLTMKMCRPTGVCWNEKETNILYVAAAYDHYSAQRIHVIDTNTDTCIAFWRGFSNPRGMLYRYDSGVGQLVIADLSNQVVVMNAENGSRINSYDIQGYGRYSNAMGYPHDVAFHPHDIYNQLFVCDAEHVIQAIQCP